MSEPIGSMLSGGHPNSLGRTVEVVELVLTSPERLEDLFACYRSDDEVVRLRTSNALKRVAAERPALVVPFLDRLIEEVGALDQASAQWTLAQLFARMANAMTPAQRAGALRVLKRNLAEHQDWIVLNMTMETLAGWAEADEALALWLLPHFDRLTQDPRKSVASKAAKMRKALG